MEADEVARHWEENAEAWARQARAGLDVYRDALNTPAFLTMLPPIAGLEGLDVGCGEGANTRELARRGARMHAVDIAPTFVRHARAAEIEQPLGITFEVGDGMVLPFADARFDFVTAFMSLMDMICRTQLGLFERPRACFETTASFNFLSCTPVSRRVTAKCCVTIRAKSARSRSQATSTAPTAASKPGGSPPCRNPNGRKCRRFGPHVSTAP